MGWTFFPLSPPLPEQQLLFLAPQAPAEKAVVWGSFQLAREQHAVPQYRTFPQGSGRDNIPAAKLQDAPCYSPSATKSESLYAPWLQFHRAGSFRYFSCGFCQGDHHAASML